MANRKWQLNKLEFSVQCCLHWDVTWHDEDIQHCMARSRIMHWQHCRDHPQRIVRIFDTDIWCPHIRRVTPTDTIHCMSWQGCDNRRHRMPRISHIQRVLPMVQIPHICSAWQQYLTSHGENVQYRTASIFQLPCIMRIRTIVHGMAKILEMAKRPKSTSPGEDSCHSIERMYSSKWWSLTSQRSWYAMSWSELALDLFNFSFCL